MALIVHNFGGARHGGSLGSLLGEMERGASFGPTSPRLTGAGASLSFPKATAAAQTLQNQVKVKGSAEVLAAVTNNHDGAWRSLTTSADLSKRTAALMANFHNLGNAAKVTRAFSPDPSRSPGQPGQGRVH